MTLKRIFLNSALVAFFLLSGCSSFTSKTEDYASWFPGDDLLKVNDKDEAWTECFSRDPSDCKEKYIQLNNVYRLKSGVIQTASKTFYCKLSDIQDINIQAAKCTSNGWVYGDELLIVQNSTEKYHKCDAAGIRVMRASYEQAGEKFGRLTSFISLNDNGELFLYRASDDMNIEIDNDNASAFEIVMGFPLVPGYFGTECKLIQYLEIGYPQKARTVREALAAHVSYTTNFDARTISSAGSSYACKLYFSKEGNVQAGWYNVSSSISQDKVTTRWQKTE